MSTPALRWPCSTRSCFQRTDRGDALFEIDSNGNEADTPRTKLTVSNFTSVSSLAVSAPTTLPPIRRPLCSAAILDITLINGIIATPTERVHPPERFGQHTGHTERRGRSSCSATRTSTSAPAASTPRPGRKRHSASGQFANNNNDAFTPTLTSLFINGTNETGRCGNRPHDGCRPSSTTPPTSDAVQPVTREDTWYAGWTCNSATANFGSTSGSCTSLPTT